MLIYLLFDSFRINMQVCSHIVCVCVCVYIYAIFILKIISKYLPVG